MGKVVNANFCNADLRGANFSGCDIPIENLRGANLDGAHMNGTHFLVGEARIPATQENIQSLANVYGFSASEVLASPAVNNPLMDVQLAPQMMAALEAAQAEGAIAALASMGESAAMREPPPQQIEPTVKEFAEATFAVADAGANGMGVGAAGGAMSDAVRQAQQDLQLA